MKRFVTRGEHILFPFLCREVKNATAEMRAKIQKLVDVGLLGFAQ